MGESLFKGLKVNGSLYTGKIEGLKVNGQIQQGFFINGNWYEPGPFECVLNFLNPVKSGEAGIKIYLKDNVSSITYYINGVEYSKSASTAGGTVYLYESDGLSTSVNGAIFKVYDGIKGIYLIHPYTNTDSKGNQTTLNESSVKSITRFGQYMTGTAILFQTVDIPRPINIPCNITSATNASEDLQYWQRLFYCKPHTIPISLSDYTCTKKSDGTYYVSSGYTINWQRPDDPNNKCTTLYAESPTSPATAGDPNWTNYIMYYNVYLVPVTVREIVLSSNANNSLGYFYTTVKKGDAADTSYVLTSPTICVFWDRNGYIKGDSSKPVTNFTYIAIASTSDANQVCPIVKYWGEWGKSTLSSLGYNMSLLAYPELLPD